MIPPVFFLSGRCYIPDFLRLVWSAAEGDILFQPLLEVVRIRMTHDPAIAGNCLPDILNADRATRVSFGKMFIDALDAHPTGFPDSDSGGRDDPAHKLHPIDHAPDRGLSIEPKPEPHPA